MSPEPPALPPGALPGTAPYVPSPVGGPPPGHQPPTSPRPSNPGFALAAFGLALVAAIGFPILYFAIAFLVPRAEEPENMIAIAAVIGLGVTIAAIVLSIWALVVARRGEGGRKVLAVFAVIIACISPATSFAAAVVSWIFIGGVARGRPLRRRDGSAAVAPVEPREDWAIGADAPRTDDLSADHRRALADAWLVEAGHEHASIAAFGRLALDLLAVGAPPELVLRANVAALEEIAHARAAFAIARVYAGKLLGPAALPDAVAPLGAPGESFGDRVQRMVFEGIVDGLVGEGAASRVAAEAALRAEGDLAIANAQRRVATDEASHALLGWDVAHWLLREHPADAQPGKMRALEALRRLGFVEPAIQSEARLRGRLTRAEERAILAGEARRVAEGLRADTPGPRGPAVGVDLCAQRASKPATI